MGHFLIVEREFLLRAVDIQQPGFGVAEYDKRT